MMEFFSGNSERLLTVIYLFIFSLFYIDYCFLKKNYLVSYHSIPSEAFDDSKNGQDNITTFVVVISTGILKHFVNETEEY